MLFHRLAAVSVSLVWITTVGYPESQNVIDRADPQESEYKIGPGDVLTINIWKNEDLSRAVQVRPDGKISLVLLNDVHAAGLSPMQLRDIVRDKLSDFVSSPEVSVIVDEVHSFRMSILGHVQNPGRYELSGPTTVLDAIALAGGFLQDDFFSPDEIIVLRRQGKETERITIKYKAAVSATSKQENIFVRADDIIVVQ